MNKQRRQAFERIAAAMRAAVLIVEDELDTLRGLHEEEQDAMESMPENLHGGERYAKMEEICDTMDGAIDEISTAAGSITEALELIEGEIA